MRKTMAFLLVLVLMHLVVTPAHAARTILSEPQMVGPDSNIETTVLSVEVFPQDLGQCFDFKSYGLANTKANPAGNLTLRFKETGAATSFSTTTIPLPAGLSQVRYVMEGQFFVRGTDASNAYLEVHGTIELVSANNPKVKIEPVSLMVMPMIDLNFEDDEYDTIDVTFQFQTSAAANALRVDTFSVGPV